MPLGLIEAIVLRSTFIAINQANETGDYSVLQALIAPDIAQALPPDMLATIFRPWREKRRDIGFAAIAEPQLNVPATQTSNGEWQLIGTVPMPGFVLAFDFSFRKVGDRWTLTKFALSDGVMTVNSTLPDYATRAPAAEPTPPSAPAQEAPAQEAPAQEPVAKEPPARAAPDAAALRTPPLPPDRPWF